MKIVNEKRKIKKLLCFHLHLSGWVCTICLFFVFFSLDWVCFWLNEHCCVCADAVFVFVYTFFLCVHNEEPLSSCCMVVAICCIFFNIKFFPGFIHILSTKYDNAINNVFRCEMKVFCIQKTAIKKTFLVPQNKLCSAPPPLPAATATTAEKNSKAQHSTAQKKNYSTNIYRMESMKQKQQKETSRATAQKNTLTHTHRARKKLI